MEEIIGELDLQLVLSFCSLKNVGSSLTTTYTFYIESKEIPFPFLYCISIVLLNIRKT